MGNKKKYMRDLDVPDNKSYDNLKSKVQELKYELSKLQTKVERLGVQMSLLKTKGRLSKDVKQSYLDQTHKMIIGLYDHILYGASPSEFHKEIELMRGRQK